MYVDDTVTYIDCVLYADDTVTYIYYMQMILLHTICRCYCYTHTLYADDTVAYIHSVPMKLIHTV